jgi:RNA polymerase sigma-70 factor (ECF subfamily)
MWPRPSSPALRVSFAVSVGGFLRDGLSIPLLFFEKSSEDEARPGPDAGAGWESETDPERLAEELTNRFWERIRLFAARRVRDVALAEDVAQEAIQTTLQALQQGRIRDRKALPAFLFQTAKHICLHRARSAGRESRAMVAFAVGLEEATSGDALADLITFESLEKVRAALDGLPAADRDLLRAAFVESEDTDSIARRLGTTAATLRVRKHRALQKLAVILGRRGRNAPAGAGT